MQISVQFAGRILLLWATGNEKNIKTTKTFPAVQLFAGGEQPGQAKRERSSCYS
jgi:hypothetical protein